jgi:transposase InsO family protein
MWQTDFTHYSLTGGLHVEILNFLDDHSRYLLACTAFPRVTGAAVVEVFRAAIARHGPPASVLSDNGMVFTTRFAGGRAGHNARNGFETELAYHQLLQKNSSPNHPQTCGKIERFQCATRRMVVSPV